MLWNPNLSTGTPLPQQTSTHFVDVQQMNAGHLEGISVLLKNKSPFRKKKQLIDMNSIFLKYRKCLLKTNNRNSIEAPLLQQKQPHVCSFKGRTIATIIQERMQTRLTESSAYRPRSTSHQRAASNHQIYLSHQRSRRTSFLWYVLVGHGGTEFRALGLGLGV